MFSKKHAKNPKWCVLGMLRNLELRRKRSSCSLQLVPAIVDFLGQAKFLVNANFSTLESGIDCCVISKLCQILAEHRTLQQLTFGPQQTLSREKLLLLRNFQCAQMH